MNTSPVISIITVVYNDRTRIGETIRSVLDQSYGHIEYIIVDGGSSDGTLDVIREHEGIGRLISEPDNGLYDAMNKGLTAASGDYVWYLNSGDRVFGRDTVERMVAGLEGVPDVVYGGTMIIDEEGREIGDRRLKPPDSLSWKSFRQGMIVCHQSLVVKRAIAVEYNLEYTISADIDWAIRCTRNAGSIHNSGLILSRFLEGGLSGTTHIMKGLKERFRIMWQYYGLVPTLLRHVAFGIRLTRFYIRNRRI